MHQAPAELEVGEKRAGHHQYGILLLATLVLLEYFRGPYYTTTQATRLLTTVLMYIPRLFGGFPLGGGLL